MAPNDKHENERTKIIPIQDEPTADIEQAPLQRAIHPEQNAHYELHIEPAATPAAPQQAKQQKSAGVQKSSLVARQESSHKTTTPTNSVKPTIGTHGSSLKQKLRAHRKAKKQSRLVIKIWNFLEWIAVSAVIFLAFFFVMNWDAYSELLQLKIAQVTGNFQVNPFIQELFNTDEAPPQQLLPIAETPEQSIDNIPPLDIAIAPPDDRIIIPRINKNVPVVSVNTENLIRRDWAALEADIQEALRAGVVHYPGTAQAGGGGNVVITGHSSYFPWDPGRFKDVFALLHEVVVGDEVVVYHNQEPYRYKVYETRVITPDQVDVLTQDGEDKLTLITCTPVGTNLKRLVVLAEPVR